VAVDAVTPNKSAVNRTTTGYYLGDNWCLSGKNGDDWLPDNIAGQNLSKLRFEPQTTIPENIPMIYATSDPWTGMQLLFWVATRDKELADSFKGLHFVEDAERFLQEWRGSCSPNRMTISEAFEEVRARFGAITPSIGDWPRYEDGTPAMFNIHEFNLFEISFAQSLVTQIWAAQSVCIASCPFAGRAIPAFDILCRSAGRGHPALRRVSNLD
jgi:hypothetical protein